MIDTDLDGLFEKLEQKELERYILRLEEIPDDISNLFSRLASVSLPHSYYDRFKAILLKLKANINDNSSDYRKSIKRGLFFNLMYQHFVSGHLKMYRLWALQSVPPQRVQFSPF